MNSEIEIDVSQLIDWQSSSIEFKYVNWVSMQVSYYI